LELAKASRDAPELREPFFVGGEGKHRSSLLEARNGGHGEFPEIDNRGPHKIGHLPQVLPRQRCRLSILPASDGLSHSVHGREVAIARIVLIRFGRGGHKGPGRTSGGHLRGRVRLPWLAN